MAGRFGNPAGGRSRGVGFVLDVGRAILRRLVGEERDVVIDVVEFELTRFGRGVVIVRFIGVGEILRPWIVIGFKGERSGGRVRIGARLTEGTTEILKLGRFCWYRLDSIQAIRREGEAMRNCLASGQYNHVHDLPGHGAYDGLYSLRDGKGRSCLTTLLWRGNATQAYERANRPVSPELRPNLKALEEYIRQNQGEGTTANQEGQTSN